MKKREMTTNEKIDFIVKMSRRIAILEQAAAILKDEPFVSKEPDNEEFCAGLRKRIERLRSVEESVRVMLRTDAAMAKLGMCQEEETK